MATPQENLARFQEISNRGLQGQLSADKRARFDEAVNRGLITVGGAEPTTLESVIGAAEVAGTVGSGIATEIAGGVAGGIQALSGDLAGGVETLRGIQSQAFQPQTEAGQAQLATLGGLVQKGIDLANFPISGLAGLAELVSGQGLDQAAETIRNVQAQGLGVTAGERVFEETGSPLAATVAQVAPTAALEIAGLGALRAAPAATRQVGAQVARAVETAAPVAREVAGEVVGVGTDLFNIQSPTKKRIGQLIEQGSDDVETAGFQIAGKVEPKTKLGRAIGVGGPKVVKDRVAGEAIKQGFDEGVIAAIKGASPADKSSMAKQVTIMEKGKKNARFAATNRPSDVVGDLLLDKIKTIRRANKEAGQAIDRVSKSLRGESIDLIEPVNAFAEGLDNLGVKLVRDSKGDFVPNFDESVLPPGDRAPLREVIRQMNLSGKDGIDGLSAHKMKRIIDNNVTYGKVKTGISGDAERLLKGFRSGIDDALDSTFPDYNKANVQYAETITTLDNIQDVAGRKMDLSGGNADKALGTLLRRIMSNAQSRVTLLDSVNDIERVAKKYGGKLDGQLQIEGTVQKGLDNDLLTQILFVDELDAVFGPVARTSFQGQIKQAVGGVASAAAEAKVSPVTAGVKAVAAGADKLRGINQAAQFKAIKDLLRGRK